MRKHVKSSSPRLGKLSPHNPQLATGCQHSTPPPLMVVGGVEVVVVEMEVEVVAQWKAQ